MNLLVFGKDTEELKGALKKEGFTLTEKDPDIIMCFGGDGTFLMAEHQYPEIPKLILKSSRICKLFSGENNENAIELFRKGRYRIEEIDKVEVLFGEKILRGTNEIILHNSNPRYAIRYNLSIDKENIKKEHVIGDGVVVATKRLGATGYYRSITDSIFYTGIGLAFNNSTEKFDHMVLEEDSEIKISIERGPAHVYADNQEDSFELNEGDDIVIRKSREKARIIKF